MFQVLPLASPIACTVVWKSIIPVQQNDLMHFDIELLPWTHVKIGQNFQLVCFIVPINALKHNILGNQLGIIIYPSSYEYCQMSHSLPNGIHRFYVSGSHGQWIKAGLTELIMHHGWLWMTDKGTAIIFNWRSLKTCVLHLPLTAQVFSTWPGSSPKFETNSWALCHLVCKKNKSYHNGMFRASFLRSTATLSP